MIPRAVHHEWEKEWVAPDQRGSAFITRVCISTFSVFPDLLQNLPAFAECVLACTNGWQLIRGAHITRIHALALCAFIPGLVATEMISVPPRSLLVVI